MTCAQPFAQPSLLLTTLSKITDQCLSCTGRAGGEQLALLIVVPLIMLILGVIASVFRLRSVYKKLQSSGGGDGGGGAGDQRRADDDELEEQPMAVDR